MTSRIWDRLDLQNSAPDDNHYYIIIIIIIIMGRVFALGMEPQPPRNGVMDFVSEEQGVH